jgi:Ricin-type beta-trefoil lectin domain
MGVNVMDQPTERPDVQRSAPELEFLQRWRPLIDRVGGDGGQVRAAKHLNWTTSTVSRDYKGDTLPTDDRLQQLCSALQLSPTETLNLAALLSRARSARRERVRNRAAERPADGKGDAAETSSQETAADRPPPPLGHAAPRRRDWLRSGRGRVVTAVITVAVVAGAAAGFALSGSGAPAATGKPPAHSKPPDPRQPVAKGAFPGLTLYRVPIPAASLSPSLKAAFPQGHASGFMFRNSMNTSLCLTAVNSGPKAGRNGDAVVVSGCRRAANEIWIPEQWETKDLRFTHLVNDQYQTMCLNADNLGGLSNGHIVQLWDCYPAGNEMWDFGDWHKTVSTGRGSYPLFGRAARMCLDADKYDLRVGTPVRIWTQYPTPNQFWS